MTTAQDQQSRAELLPCPFCGQQSAYVEQLDSDASVVICDAPIGEYCACLARGPVAVRDDEDEVQPGRNAAIDAWNRRAPATQELKPLTDERIREIDDETHFHESPDWPVRFARGIEAAQGIK